MRERPQRDRGKIGMARKVHGTRVAGLVSLAAVATERVGVGPTNREGDEDARGQHERERRGNLPDRNLGQRNGERLAATMSQPSATTDAVLSDHGVTRPPERASEPCREPRTGRDGMSGEGEAARQNEFAPSTRHQPAFRADSSIGP